MKSRNSREYMALYLGAITLILLFDLASTMSAEVKMKAKEHVVELFYHAYNAYMENAYPADELMPLSCKGRWRGSEPSRGDVDDTLGNFTLTLIDSVDTLAVLGDVEGFEEAVLNIIKDARFDCDVIVSVFETNIRILGGLLGGHVMAAYFKRLGMGLSWYNDELLARAKEVGDRLLPAFNTSTGIPYPRINLKHGIVPRITSSYHDTCTACAGSMILEFAALSRLTGISVYEEKARKAMDYLWQQRHRTSDLMGLIINIHNGDWIRRESGVGAGIDSYYEYVLKAYILLGDDNYLDRFNKHYDAVMRYVSQGPLLMDVHMHKPHAISRNFMDALLAFWPGLQVLKGDLVPAIETHEMLYQVLQRHNFIPEAFTTDFRVHWSHHPLRPEFIESTYFLYKATGDHYYLEVGRKVLDNLEAHARVDCGLAAIKNVKTGAHEDQMDSYVLAEMFKYLYLLFAEKEDMKVDIDDFIFTTEAHLLPLSLSIGNMSASVPKIRREAYSFKVDLTPPPSDSYVTTTTAAHTTDENCNEQQNDNYDDCSHYSDDDDGGGGEEGNNMCPALHTTHEAGQGYPHSVRSQMQHIVNRANPQRKNRTPRLRASDFIAGNKEQLEQLHAMGIRIATMADGRVQLLHTASEALSPDDAEDGMQFMQEMIELSKHQQQEPQHDPMFIHVGIPGLKQTEIIRAGPAQFGYSLKEKAPVTAMLAISRPFRVCKEIENEEELAGHIVILERGDCMFVEKARNLQRIGARGGIVIDHTEGSTSDSQPLFAMSGDGTNDVNIPLVFLYHAQGQQLLQLLADNSFLEVTLTATAAPPSDSTQHTSTDPTASTAEPQGIQASSGRAGMEDSDPVPLLGQKPRVPSSDAKSTTPGNGVDDDEDDDDDSFFDHLDDKFYHHEAQLRDLYYLQAGSRYLHVNVEVRPSAAKPPPLSEQTNAFSLDVLPDSSKMVTARLTYQTADSYELVKPHLNRLYLDTVHLLQQHTNFDQLPHATDYLRALARCLEAGYFGLQRVDKDALTLMRGLSRQLQYVHVFPSRPDRPVVAGSGSESTKAESDEEKLSPYAGVEDFVELSSSSSVGGDKSGVQSAGEDHQGGGSQQYVRYVRPNGRGDSGSEYAARVDDEGRLNLVVQDPSSESSPEAGQTPGRRNAFSVRVSADSEQDIRVKISEDGSGVSHMQSFSAKDDDDSAPPSPRGSAHIKVSHPRDPQPHISSAEARDQTATASNSQSDSSGSSSSSSQSANAAASSTSSSATSSSSSSQPLGQSAASRDSEGDGEERTAGLEGNVQQGESIERGGRSSGVGRQHSDRTPVVSSVRGEEEEREGSGGRGVSGGDRTRDHRLDDEL